MQDMMTCENCSRLISLLHLFSESLNSPILLFAIPSAPVSPSSSFLHSAVYSFHPFAPPLFIPSRPSIVHSVCCLLSVICLHIRTAIPHIRFSALTLPTSRPSISMGYIRILPLHAQAVVLFESTTFAYTHRHVLCLRIGRRVPSLL